MRVVWITSALSACALLFGIVYILFLPSLPGDGTQQQLAAIINPFVEEEVTAPVDLMTWEQSSVAPSVSGTEATVNADTQAHDEIKTPSRSDAVVANDMVANNNNPGLTDREQGGVALNRDRFDELAYNEMLKMAKTIGSADDAIKGEPLVDPQFRFNYPGEKMVSVIQDDLLKEPGQEAALSPSPSTDNNITGVGANRKSTEANPPESEKSNTSIALLQPVVTDATRIPKTQLPKDADGNLSDDVVRGEQVPESDNDRQGSDSDAKRALKAALREKYLESSGDIDAYPEGDDAVPRVWEHASEMDSVSSDVDNGMDKIAIIVHSGNEDEISIADLKNIYLDRITHWDNGANIALYNLPLDDRWREVFSQRILNMSALDAANAESNRAITNKVGNLSQIKKVNLVVSYVARNPNAIAYVPLSSISENTRVKVVMTVP